MSPEPSGFGDFPRTEGQCYLGGGRRDTATDHCSPDPTIEHLVDAYRGINGEGPRRDAGGGCPCNGRFMARRER